MMRWNHRIELEARGCMLLLAAAMLVLGIAQLRNMPKTSAGVQTPTVEVRRKFGALCARSRRVDHGSLEQDLLNGVAFLHTIRSASLPASPRSRWSSSPHGHPRCSAGGEERLHKAHCASQVSKPPQMLQPVSSTSRVMMVGCPRTTFILDRDVLARVAGTSGAPDGRPRRRKRLGVRSRERQLQSGRSRAPPCARCVAPADNRDDRERSSCVEPELRRGITPGTRRDHRDAQSASGSSTPSFRLAGRSREGRRQDTGPALTLRLGDVTNVVEDHHRSSATRCSPMVWPAAGSRKLPGAKSLDVTAASSGPGDLRRAFGDHDRQFALPTRHLHREIEQQLITNAGDRCGPGACPRCLPVRMEECIGRRRCDELSLLVAILVCPGRTRRFNSMIVAGLGAGARRRDRRGHHRQGARCAPPA